MSATFVLLKRSQWVSSQFFWLPTQLFAGKKKKERERVEILQTILEEEDKKTSYVGTELFLLKP